MENCKNDRLFKIHNKYENSVNIRPRVKAISPKVYIGVFIINPQKDKACIEGVQRRVFVRIDEKL